MTLHARTKPYPAYKPSGVEWLSDVPSHWEVKRLKYSAPVHNAKLDNKPEDTIYVGLENIEPWTGELLLDYQPDSVDSTVVTFAPGDVLFGKLRPYLAKVARPGFEGTATSEVLVLRPSDQCSQGYLAYCLLSAPYVHWIDTLTYGARMPRVSPDEVACSFIPLPPLPEQLTIAKFLDRETARIDALVSRKERLIGLLQEKRTALITRAVTRGLDPNAPMKDSGIEWLGEIPAHWEVKRLKHLASMRAGAGILGTEIVEMGDYPVFGGNGIRGYTSSFTHDGEHPLIGRQGALCGAINHASGRFWATEHAVVVDAGESVETDYLTYTLIAMSLNRYAQSAAQPGLNIEVIGNVSAALPPIPEQCTIAAFLDRETAKLDALVAKVEEVIDHLKELRTALISAAVTGRIDVREEAG